MRITVFITIWVVWCARKASVITSVNRIQSMLSACAKVFGSSPAASPLSVSPRLVAWTKPMEGTVCLNVDGSLLGSANTAGDYGYFPWLTTMLGERIPESDLFLGLDAFGNVCVVVMAKMSAMSTSRLVKIDTPFHELLHPLFADARGVVFTRD
ncbi:hypothetical protein TSUD_04340 [Trifolium subterraneum]|nr:hypothetical protein TSUD_04340 [Trifolium subterraneum]